MERVGNIYFELTEVFNAQQPIAVLGSGQAVVYHRLAIMSKDGDWILEETSEACERVLGFLAERGARYRPGAPLDVRRRPWRRPVRRDPRPASGPASRAWDAVVLAPAEGEDGLLRPDEIARLALPLDLVVLASCRSGLPDTGAEGGLG